MSISGTDNIYTMAGQLGNEPRRDGVNNLLDNVPMHSGIPPQQFNTWFKLFTDDLGTKSQDSYTLKQVWLGRDQGGVNFVGNAANADQTRAHVMRKTRLHDILMTKIDKDAPIYNELAGMIDGVSSINYFKLIMHIPMSDQSARMAPSNASNRVSPRVATRSAKESTTSSPFRRLCARRVFAFCWRFVCSLD